jgi:hypothetical protein
VVKVWSYTVPMFDTVVPQFMSSGEQNLPSGMLAPLTTTPLTTLWNDEAHMQRTVSPTLMVTVAGSKTSMPPGPTITVTMELPMVVLVVVVGAGPVVTVVVVTVVLGVETFFRVNRGARAQVTGRSVLVSTSCTSSTLAPANISAGGRFLCASAKSALWVQATKSSKLRHHVFTS